MFLLWTRPATAAMVMPELLSITVINQNTENCTLSATATQWIMWASRQVYLCNTLHLMVPQSSLHSSVLSSRKIKCQNPTGCESSWILLKFYTFSCEMAKQMWETLWNCETYHISLSYIIMYIYNYILIYYIYNIWDNNYSFLSCHIFTSSSTS